MRGRWDCEHQRGEELGLSGMDSVCEILINVVTANKPKVLTGLPKGNGASTGGPRSPVVNSVAPGGKGWT